MMITRRGDPELHPSVHLNDWCHEWLGAFPLEVLFEAGYVGYVVGLRLQNGEEVVVKARRWDQRIVKCVEVQHRLWRTGLPVPEPLIGPHPLSGWAATAERYVVGGEVVAWGDDNAERSAEALARFVHEAGPADGPALSPPPPWSWWDYDAGMWPPAEDVDIDLGQMAGPTWLDDAARRARRRLSAFEGRDLVGHVDWEAQNMRWRGGTLHVVYDWDSAAARSEPVIAGLAAAAYTNTGWRRPTQVSESATFLKAYAQARGTPWSDDELEVCWAAGLWVRCFNAKKDLAGRPDHPAAVWLYNEVDERLRAAGA